MLLATAREEELELSSAAAPPHVSQAKVVALLQAWPPFLRGFVSLLQARGPNPDVQPLADRV